jgi:transposase
MNYSNFNCFLYGNDYPIIKWEENDEINFWLKSNISEVHCPKCNCVCNKSHEKHSRKIQDTPIHNKKVYINIDVREFICDNIECEINTFTEEIPFAGKNQVRTYALTEFILIHAIYMSSNSTSLILSFLGIDVSSDTVDNILKNIHIQDNPDVERIGIDDVAIRKGMKYATAIYDLDTHHLIALLEGREKDDIVPWLKAHKKIKVVARDRASAYAEAINEVLPNAVQVADRFHLFENLIKYLKEMFYSEIPRQIVIKDNEILNKKATKVISELSNIDWGIVDSFEYTNDVPLDENGKEIKFIDVEYDINDEMHLKQKENRQKKYEDIILIRKDKDLPMKELTKKYNYSSLSIKKYLEMTDQEVEQVKNKKNYNRKKTEFSNYTNIVYKMLNDNQPYEYILAYVLKSGYKGSITNLKGKIYKLAKNNNFEGITFSKYNKYEYASNETIITRCELLKYILTLNDKKSKNKEIEENLKIIEDKFPIVTNIKNIFKDFHDTIFSKDTELLDIFIELYKNELPSFCNGLKKDIAAVKNAISNSINSGFVEGNNNKFKLIKRIVYGKQKLVNLFKRCYLAFASTLDDLSLLKIAISPFI